jgi:hypothetical protein
VHEPHDAQVRLLHLRHVEKEIEIQWIYKQKR